MKKRTLLFFFVVFFLAPFCLMIEEYGLDGGLIYAVAFGMGIFFTPVLIEYLEKNDRN